MAGFKINQFSGLVPRVPESLLPERAATVAENCDFAYGELRNTRGGFFLQNLVNQAKSIYTEDGLRFFSWPYDVSAVRSPLAKDQYNRFYFTDTTYLRVGGRLEATIGGGEPILAYRAGVPRPTATPTLAVSLPVISAATVNLTYKFHYEANGVKYQEQTVSPTLAGTNKFRFTPPEIAKQLTFSSQDEFPETGQAGVIYVANDTGNHYAWSGGSYAQTTTEGTPATATPVLRITGTSVADASQLFDLYTDNSDFESTGGLYSLSMAKDSGQSTYTATITVAVKEADKETRAYVFTFVNTLDEEGPPSAAATVDTSPLVDVNVTFKKEAATDFAPIKEIRVYRTSSTVAEFFYVGAVPCLGIAVNTPITFLDNVRGAELNNPIESTDYYPPEAGLTGLMTLPNGILCAWKGAELHFSEAYKPWAWPPKYVKPLPNNIVGGIPHGSGAIITTLAHPYVVSGVSPDSMTTTRINVDQAGVSRWSLAVVDGAAMYASNDGIVVLTGNTASLVPSSRFFTREVWRTRYANGLSGMRFAVWDGRLVVFHGTGAFVPFMIRFDEADGTLTDLPGFTANCAFISQLSDQFYYVQDRGLYQFNGGSALSSVWQSRELVLNAPTNFGMAQTLTEGTWTIKFYADGVLRHTQSLATEGTTRFRLPSGFKADRWKVRIEGSGKFRELRVARTGVELATL